MNVLQAAKIRIRNVFANGCKIYLSFSSGKDSLCMANLVYEMILSGELDPKQLTVTFIDEEGLYPSMVDAAHRWRRNFLSVGAKFLWFCLPFKQVCVIDHLSASESWITWEPGKEDVWMRTPPDFAIRYSPYLHHPGEMNYQTFCEKAFRDGIQLVGPMKAIVKKLMDEGKTVDEIGKQLGMKPEEIFRLSGFTKDEFLNMMTKDHPTYSKAKVIRSI